MLASTLERALNRGLPGSPRAQALCAELEGRRIAIEVPNVARLLVESTGMALRVTSGAGVADAEIAGGPLGLLALAGDSAQEVLQRRGVEIRGDALVASRFRELGSLLRPDVEEALSKVIGDIPAHQVGRIARLAVCWTGRAVQTAIANVAEYLAHEKQDLVSHNEGDAFLTGVEQLREDVDRLEARLDLLKHA